VFLFGGNFQNFIQRREPLQKNEYFCTLLESKLLKINFLDGNLGGNLEIRNIDRK